MSDGEDDDALRAQAHATRNRGEIEESDRCGCFHCATTFRPGAVSGWIRNDDRRANDTARCPNCSIDAVIGSASGMKLTTPFLERCRRHWYRR